MGTSLRARILGVRVIVEVDPLVVHQLSGLVLRHLVSIDWYSEWSVGLSTIEAQHTKYY